MILITFKFSEIQNVTVDIVIQNVHVELHSRKQSKMNAFEGFVQELTLSKTHFFFYGKLTIIHLK